MSFTPVFAFLGGSVGTGEWIVLFVVILIVVGPKRLPEVARKIGRMMEMFRRAADEFKEQLMSIDQDTSSSNSTNSSGKEYSQADAGHDGYIYPDNSDYPGNEEHVNSWESRSETTPDVPSATEEPDAQAQGSPAEAQEPPVDASNSTSDTELVS